MITDKMINNLDMFSPLMKIVVMCNLNHDAVVIMNKSDRGEIDTHIL